MIQNIVVQGVREGTGVNQLLRIEPRRRRGRDIAHVVHAAAARNESERLQAREHVYEIARSNFTDLNVRARGDGRLAVAEIFRDIGQSEQLQ